MHVPLEEAIRSVVDGYFDALAAGDEDGWLDCHAADAVCFVPVGGAPSESRSELRRLFQGLRSAFERLAIEPDRVWNAPDGAAVKWTARGTGHDGRAVTFEGVDVFEIDEAGRIRTVWSYWDPQEVSRALGV